MTERHYWNVMTYGCDRCGHEIEFYLEDGCEGPRDREAPVPKEWDSIRASSPVRDQLPDTVPQTAGGRYVLPVPFVAAGCPVCQGPPPWSVKGGVLQHVRWQDDRDVSTAAPPAGAGLFHYPDDWFRTAGVRAPGPAGGPGAVVRGQPMRVFLRDLRVDAELTQQELADVLGVSRYTVNQLENGKRSLTPDMALRYSAAFGPDRAPPVELVEAWAREELERANDAFPVRVVRRVGS